MIPLAESGKRYYALLTALVAVICWVIPARSSLWLDETGTYWAAKDGIREAVQRALFFSGGSPAYYLLAWPAVKLGGGSEIAMRFPSMLAMGLAVWLLYRLGARLIDPGTGAVAAVVFASMRYPAFAASDARPYALALLILIAHVLTLLRWVESGRPADAALSAVLAALTVYVHVLFAAGLVVPALWALWLSRRAAALLVMWTATAALLIPMAVWTYRYGQSGSHSWASNPGLKDLFAIIAPPSLVISLAAVLLLGYLGSSAAPARWPAVKPVTAMLAAWTLFTPVTFFLISRLTPDKILVDRYALSSAPATALLAACIIRSFPPPLLQRVMAAALVWIAISAEIWVDKFQHGEQDWRGAMAAERAAAGGTNVPFLVQSGFVEAVGSREMNDPRLRDVLFAPQIRYPPAGRIVRLPYGYDEAFLDDVAQNLLSGTDRFLLCGIPEVKSHLLVRLASRKPAVQPLGDFGAVHLWMFQLH